MIKEINKPLTFTITFILALVALAVGNSYWFITVLCAGWLLCDSNVRHHKSWIGWVIATLILSPLVVAIYLPQRNLKAGEKREGGYAWNLSKNFCLLWTLTMIAIAFMGLGSAASSISGMTNDASIAGAGLGVALRLGLIFGLWFIVMITALIIGLLMKKSTIEEGPTGDLVLEVINGI